MKTFFFGSKKHVIATLLLALLMLFLGACTASSRVAENRNEAIGEHSAKSKFYEAKQISEIEEWKDLEGKIVMVYILNPVTGALWIPAQQCKGVPASSTESLEPNSGQGVINGGTGWAPWKYKLDGTDVVTEEMTGRDGTFGEPAPFRQCMTVDGNYLDWSAFNDNVIVTSQIFTFPEATVQRDFEAEIRLLQAEEVIKNGGCVNTETLAEIPCPGK